MNFENGRKNAPSLAEFIALCKALDADPADLAPGFAAITNDHERMRRQIRGEVYAEVISAVAGLSAQPTP